MSRIRPFGSHPVSPRFASRARADSCIDSVHTASRRPASLARLAGRSRSTPGPLATLIPPQFEPLSCVDHLAQGVADIDVAGVLDIRERFPKSHRVGIE